MTDHAPRLFADDAAVRRVGTGLLDRTLPRSEWTHEAHIAACCWLLTERPDVDAPRDLPDIIRSYNISVGGVNDDTQGYHETITQLYIAGVNAWLTAHPGDDGLGTKVNALLSSPMGQRAWPLDFFSKARLFSVEARRGRIAPDLQPWPE